MSAGLPIRMAGSVIGNTGLPREKMEVDSSRLRLRNKTGDDEDPLPVVRLEELELCGSSGGDLERIVFLLLAPEKICILMG